MVKMTFKCAILSGKFANILSYIQITTSELLFIVKNEMPSH